MVIGQGVNRLIRALTLEDFSTEVLVPLEGLSSGVSQKPLLRYYLVIVSIFFFYLIDYLQSILIENLISKLFWRVTVT